MGIEQAAISLVDEHLLRQALERLRQARPLGDTPLRRLVLVHKPTKGSQATPAPADLDMAIGSLLGQFITGGLARLRQLHGIPPPGLDTRQVLIALLLQDFAQGNTELEAWSALYHRYILLDLNLQASELSSLLNQDTRQLRRRLNHGMQRLARAIRRSEARTRRAQHRRWLKLRLPPPSYGQLHGRDDLLADLKELLNAGPPHSLLLSGPGGVGKTALAHALASQLVEEGCFTELVWVTLDHPTGYLDLLRDTASTLGIDDADQMGQAALERALLLMFSAQPVLVVIDNGHHIDNLPDVLQRLDSMITPGHLVCAARLNPVLPFSAAVVAVKPLDKDSFERMVEDLARQRRIGQIRKLHPDAVDRMHKATGGNPLAARLVVGYLDRLPFDHVLETVGSLPVGDTCLFEYLYRLAWDSLSDYARQVLLAGCLPAPTGITYSDLLRMVDIGEERLDQALDELAQHTLVEFDLEIGAYNINRLLRDFLEREARLREGSLSRDVSFNKEDRTEYKAEVYQVPPDTDSPRDQQDGMTSRQIRSSRAKVRRSIQ